MHYTLSADMKRFNHLMAETGGVYHAIAQAAGLSDSAFQVLYTLCVLGDGCLLSQVVRQADLPKQTVNSALRKLEQEGILTLASAGVRKKALHLTESGWTLCRDKILPVLKMEDDIFSAWSQAEREIYLRLTQRYLNDLQTLTKERLEGLHG